MTVSRMEPDSLRNLYLSEGIRYIPHLVELADRNRLSQTYGCFDRAYWHYRTSDFPSGMYQEAVLPLALACSIQHSKNPYYGSERLRELVVAGIGFAARSSRRDGSCDDYFPYERAAGAAAFSLYACTESLLVLGLKGEEFLGFFRRRAAHLAGEGMRESGILSNHKALIVLALYNVFLVTGDALYKEQARSCLAGLLAAQTDEGWWPEYEGCDPGYLTFTIDFLAKYFQKSADPAVIEPLSRAIEFVSHFVHPDGSLGGEYGSRNTFHFMPHGFELMGRFCPFAIPSADLFLHSLVRGTRSATDDDRICIHYPYNFLQAFRDFFSPRESFQKTDGRSFFKYFPKAGLVAVSKDRNYAAISVRKGGIGKYFKDGALRHSDCGLAGKTADGTRFMAQGFGDWESTVTESRVTVGGHCRKYSHLVFDPLKFAFFRLFMIFVGRFLPSNFMRRLVQKKAIVHKAETVPVCFKKEIPLDGTDKIRYTIELTNPSVRITELWIGSDPTFMYVATSQPFQQGSLRKWTDLSHLIGALNRERRVVYEHSLS